MVVAMSRARLGLYVFARVALFSNCFELTPSFRQLTSRPTQLHLFPAEKYPPRTERPNLQPQVTVQDMPHMHQFVYDMYVDIVQRMNKEEQLRMQSLPKPEMTSTEPAEAVQKEVPIAFEIPPLNELMEEAGDTGGESVEPAPKKSKVAVDLEEGEIEENKHEETLVGKLDPDKKDQVVQSTEEAEK